MIRRLWLRLCRLAAHETFLLSLDALSRHLAKTTRLKQVTKLEVAGYEQQATQLRTSLQQCS